MFEKWDTYVERSLKFLEGEFPDEIKNLKNNNNESEYNILKQRRYQRLILFSYHQLDNVQLHVVQSQRKARHCPIGESRYFFTEQDGILVARDCSIISIFIVSDTQDFAICSSLPYKMKPTSKIYSGEKHKFNKVSIAESQQAFITNVQVSFIKI